MDLSAFMRDLVGFDFAWYSLFLRFIGSQNNRVVNASITWPALLTPSLDIDGTNPDPCLSSYVSYALADIAECEFFYSILSSLSISTRLRPLYTTKFSVVTAGGLSRECDGISRVQYVSTTTKTVFDRWNTVDVYRNGSIPEAVSRRLIQADYVLPRSVVEPYPRCSIPRESCAQQWILKAKYSDPWWIWNTRLWSSAFSWEADWSSPLAIRYTSH
jgi:hypothetical protein